MFSKERLTPKKSLQVEAGQIERLIEPLPLVEKVNMRPWTNMNSNSLSYWFGAEAAFADDVSMQIIGGMAYERHTFPGNSRWAAVGVLERWKESVKF